MCSAVLCRGCGALRFSTEINRCQMIYHMQVTLNIALQVAVKSGNFPAFNMVNIQSENVSVFHTHKLNSHSLCIHNSLKEMSKLQKLPHNLRSTQHKQCRMS